MASAVKIPVITSGGAGAYQYMVDAVMRAGDSVIAAASMFHFNTGQISAGAKVALSGVPVGKASLGLDAAR